MSDPPLSATGQRNAAAIEETPMNKPAMLIVMAAALGNSFALADDSAITVPPSAQGGLTGAVDNSGINTRDRTGTTLIPQHQPNMPEDRQLLAAVRRAVVGEKALSSMAHNVKIFAVAGVVTLRGPVRSDVERDRVEQIAQTVPGVASVVNELDFKTRAN
jgi:hyperosmotically inducible protein